MTSVVPVLREAAHRTSRGTARLNALLEIATDMFLEQGYEAMSLDALIARAGGSRRNIYDHFGSKEGLFMEVIEKLSADFWGALEELETENRDVRSVLTMFGARILDSAFKPRKIALLRLLIAEGHRISAWTERRAEARCPSRVLVGWIREMQAENRLRADMPAADLGEQFVNLVVSGRQLRLLVGLIVEPPNPEECRRIVDQAVEMFLCGAGGTRGRQA